MRRVNDVKKTRDGTYMLVAGKGRRRGAGELYGICRARSRLEEETHLCLPYSHSEKDMHIRISNRNG